MGRHLRRVMCTIAALVVLSPPAASAEPGGADNHIAYYERLLSRNRWDARTYYRLGDAFIRKARESGDVVYLARAEAALQQSLALTPRNAGALRHLAYVFYLRHDFTAAAAYATRAVTLDPDDGDAYGVLGDAYLETGRYHDAETAYRSMMARGADLYALARLAGLKSIHGDARAAIADLQRALDVARVAPSYPAESVAWTAWQLGAEYFAIGDLDAAHASYLAALETQPNYYRALAGLAQVLTAQARYDDAIALYKRALGVVPLPEYAVALGDVYARLGRTEDARKQYDLVEYIGRLNALNRVIYNRELAYFYADHDRDLARALELARLEITARQDVYGYDVLAWALYKNGRIEEAMAAMTEALKHGTRDARLFFHAGLIHGAAGNADAARDYLRRALATNPRFHVWQADKARAILAVEEVRR
ncbi:MAG TPA: tetratricopeptide repeat protein [Methylomirabilota bacterium]